MSVFDSQIPFHPAPLPPSNYDFRNPDLLELLVKARSSLASLNGYASALPNPLLLMSPHIIKESVASSNIENINTTVVDFIQGQLFPESEQRAPDKEVARYREALLWGFRNLEKFGLSTRLIVGIQKELLEFPEDGYRRIQNRIEKTITRETIFTPMESSRIPHHISELEEFMNAGPGALDPLIRCILAHYQFEAIHPFSDGNGRTGRILMVLHLIQSRLLDLPILFISGYLNKNRNEYYQYLREVSSLGNWDGYLRFMLNAFTIQSLETNLTLFGIMKLHAEMKDEIRKKASSIYSSELVDHFFYSPITRPSRMGDDLKIHYTTASTYLKRLAQLGLLKNKRVGKYHLFMNWKLVDLLRK